MAQESRKTPKGAPPMPTRVATKHKRPDYGRELMRVRADRFEQRTKTNEAWCERNKVAFRGGQTHP